MLPASRLTETHARAAQTRPAEPAGEAAELPAPGPAAEPEVHDAASVMTPNAATQIRLPTTDLPAPAQRHYGTKPSPPRRLRHPVPPGFRSLAPGQRPHLNVPAKPRQALKSACPARMPARVAPRTHAQVSALFGGCR